MTTVDGRKVRALINASADLLAWAEAQRLWHPDDDELMPAIRAVRQALAEMENP